MERMRRQSQPVRQPDRAIEAHAPRSVLTGNEPEFENLDQQPAGITVISGASIQSLPLEGLSIARARALAGAILHIDPQATILVNGQPANEDYSLMTGDALEFVHHAGEKGSGDETPP